MKHEFFKKNDGKWSCRVCQWTFYTCPRKDDCPGLLRIECATDEYKTGDQWKKLGYKPIVQPGHVFPTTDAVSIVHSTTWYRYYHRSNVVKIEA